MGYQYNNLGMLTGFCTSSSYYLDATDYDATGQDEGAVHSPVGCKVTPRMRMPLLACSITARMYAWVPSSRSAVKKAAPGSRRPENAGTATR